MIGSATNFFFFWDPKRGIEVCETALRLPFKSFTEKEPEKLTRLWWQGTVTVVNFPHAQRRRRRRRGRSVQSACGCHRRAGGGWQDVLGFTVRLSGWSACQIVVVIVIGTALR